MPGTITIEIDPSEWLRRLRELEASVRVLSEQNAEIKSMLIERNSRFDAISAQLVKLELGQQKECAENQRQVTELKLQVKDLRDDFDNFTANAQKVFWSVTIPFMLFFAGFVWALVTHKIQLVP